MRNLTASLLAGTWLCATGVAVAGDWPQHRGPRRQGTTVEPGLRESWGPGEPLVAWRRSIGEGYSAVAVAGPRACTMERATGEEWVVCLDAGSGETLWRTAVGPSRTSDLGDSGPRSTPAIDGELLFTASSAGRMVALSTADGSVVWRREFEGEAPRFGYSVSPLVDGDLVIFETGGSEESPGIIALDRATGTARWSLLAGPAGYSSPIVADIAGVRQYVFFRRAGNEVVSVSPAGELLWSHPTAALAVITTPLFHPPDRIFVASADDAFGGAMLRVRRGEGGFEVEELWNDRLMRNHFNSSVLVDGFLYGFDNGTFRCLDADSGERRWARRGFGKGSLLAAGDLLFVLSDGGTLALVEATPEEYRERGRAPATTGRAWTPPSLAHGRLYVRDFDEIVAFDVGRGAPTGPAAGATAADPALADGADP